MAGRNRKRVTYPLPTVYSIDFRWPLHPVPHEKTERERYETARQMNAYTEAEAEALLERLYKSRIRSTYDVSYTFPLSKRCIAGGETEEKDDDDESEDIDGKDNMLVQFKRTYWQEECPRPTPDLSTSKRLFGRARPAELLVGRSEYQDRLGRLGYRMLEEREKKNHGKNEEPLGKESGVEGKGREKGERHQKTERKKGFE